MALILGGVIGFLVGMIPIALNLTGAYYSVAVLAEIGCGAVFVLLAVRHKFSVHRYEFENRAGSDVVGYRSWDAYTGSILKKLCMQALGISGFLMVLINGLLLSDTLNNKSVGREIHKITKSLSQPREASSAVDKGP
jgi:hypothetical protein